VNIILNVSYWAVLSYLFSFYKSDMFSTLTTGWCMWLCIYRLDTVRSGTDVGLHVCQWWSTLCTDSSESYECVDVAADGGRTGSD